MSFLRFDLAGEDVPAQLSKALAECDRLIGLENVARQTFFLSDQANPSGLSQIIAKSYGPQAPAASLVSQPPADGNALSCEMWGFRSNTPLQRAPHVTLASTPSATWAFVGGLAGAEDAPLGEGVECLFRDVESALGPTGLEFARTVRTWYYIGDLLGTETKGMRYSQFNALRNEFYREKWSDPRRSPASTGIGMSRGQVAFESLLVKPEREDVQIAWIDNPLQTPPYLYETRGDRSRNPSFSRAAAVRHDGSTLTFISGTASIRQSKVVHVDDVAAQTEATIENMAMLVEDEALHGLLQARVYVKRAEDVNAVRQRCRALLPDAPCTYLIADVCKADCLVEIEGVHLTTRVAVEQGSPKRGARGCAAR
jgi:enamine deaminase RidA (YjgF/YER057c/UK114 family)